MRIQLFDSSTVEKTIVRISHEIAERDKTEDLVLVGVKTRGVPIARRICANLLKITGIEVPVIELDIRNFRDDIQKSVCDESEAFSADVHDKRIVIVDDVLFTARSARAAIEAVIKNGRPRCIELAVLVDRGHRELPIRPDFVGKNVPTAQDDDVVVCISEIDGHTAIEIEKCEDPFARSN